MRLIKNLRKPICPFPSSYQNLVKTKTCPLRNLGILPKDHKTTEGYYQKFSNAIASLKKEGRYRIFITIQKQTGKYPIAKNMQEEANKDIAVWCSNDYLGIIIFFFLCGRKRFIERLQGIKKKKGNCVLED